MELAIVPTFTGHTIGGGQIVIEPPSGAYFSNQTAVLKAQPQAGWQFLQWLGDAFGPGEVEQVAMNRNKTVRAVFGTTLATQAIGSGQLSVTPRAPAYPFGSQVRITAVPAEGSYFAFWANAGANSTNNPLVLTVTNANPSIVAVFSSSGGTKTNAVTVLTEGAGTVSVTPPGSRFPATAQVLLEAVPEPGQQFVRWNGTAASESGNPLTVSASSNRVITAVFTARAHLEPEPKSYPVAQEGFRAALYGRMGDVYEVQASTNAQDWLSLTVLTNTWGETQFSDPQSTNSAWRLYRLKQ